jgi:hypothetical protein
MMIVSAQPIHLNDGYWPKGDWDVLLQEADSLGRSY